MQNPRIDRIVACSRSYEPFWQSPLLSSFLLILSTILNTSEGLAQRQSESAPRATRTIQVAATSDVLTSELQSRLQTLETVKRSGDSAAIASASRSVLGLGLREMAGVQITQGAGTKAIDAYLRSIDFEDSPATRIDLAQAYFRAKRFDESLSRVTDALMADPDNARARYLQGKVWLAKGVYEQAVKSFRYALGRQEDPAASYLLGAALLQVKEKDQAKDAFRKFQGQTAGPANIHLMLADAYRAANDLDKANRELRLAGRQKRSTSKASISLETVIENAGRLSSGFELAKPIVQTRREGERVERELRGVLASALNDLGVAEAQEKQYSLALAHFHEAASWNADIPGLLRNTGIAAARAQDYRECIRTLRPVVAENSKDNVARAMLGTALFATQAYGEAVQVFTPLGDSVLQLHELAYSWAAALVHINKYSEATVLLNKLEQQPLSTETLLLVAQLWSQMGAYEKTVDSCHRGLQLDAKLPRAHYFAGLALLRLNRSAEAAEELRGELQLDPDNIDAQFHLAFSLLQQSQNQQAVELWKSVLASKPDHAEANYELGKELLLEGKPVESLVYLEAAVRLKPQFEPAHYQLQSAYRAAGRKEDAEREANIYRALKAKSRNITLPPPRQGGSSAKSPD